ncbi:hypothetical protein GCM10027347_09020 [Larkinella harenae]
MKYAVTFDIDKSVFHLRVDDKTPLTFDNHFAVAEYLEQQGLSEPDGDYIFDPVEKRFLFSEPYALEKTNS